MARVQNDLEQGILTKYKVLRTRQLEGIVVKNCYENKQFTYNEAEMCEKFHMDNDYKLNAVSNFWKDHVSRHVKSYYQCSQGLERFESVADKDRAFADCNKHWIKEFKENESQSLELRARTLLGKNLD